MSRMLLLPQSLHNVNLEDVHCVIGVKYGASSVAVLSYKC